jgi:hypothetical protein
MEFFANIKKDGLVGPVRPMNKTDTILQNCNRLRVVVFRSL